MISVSIGLTIIASYIASALSPAFGVIAGVCVMGGIILRRIDELEEKLDQVVKPERGDSQTED